MPLPKKEDGMKNLFIILIVFITIINFSNAKTQEYIC